MSALVESPPEDLLHVEEAIWVLHTPIGMPIYDFAFDRFLACRRPFQRPDAIEAIARVGAIADYPGYYERWAKDGGPDPVRWTG